MVTQSRRAVVAPMVGAVLDLVAILVFALVGRGSHAEGFSLVATLAVAAPFLVGAAAGWALVVGQSRRWPVEPGPGVTVWGMCVVVGVLLRAVFDHAIVWPFPVVAAIALAVLLLGWRALAHWVLNR